MTAVCIQTRGFFIFPISNTNQSNIYSEVRQQHTVNAITLQHTKKMMNNLQYEYELLYQVEYLVSQLGGGGDFSVGIAG